MLLPSTSQAGTGKTTTPWLPPMRSVHDRTSDQIPAPVTIACMSGEDLRPNVWPSQYIAADSIPRNTVETNIAKRGSSIWLLDHLIRSQQQRLRDREAERLRGFEVDDQLELRWLFDG